MSECSPTVMLQLPTDDENNIGTVGKLITGTYVYNCFHFVDVDFIFFQHKTDLCP